MSELTERLRSPMTMSMFPSRHDLLQDLYSQRSAAEDEIERLEKLVEEMRKALEEAR